MKGERLPIIRGPVDSSTSAGRLAAATPSSRQPNFHCVRDSAIARPLHASAERVEQAGAKCIVKCSNDQLPRQRLCELFGERGEDRIGGRSLAMPRTR